MTIYLCYLYVWNVQCIHSQYCMRIDRCFVCIHCVLPGSAVCHSHNACYLKCAVPHVSASCLQGLLCCSIKGSSQWTGQTQCSAEVQQWKHSREPTPKCMKLSLYQSISSYHSHATMCWPAAAILCMATYTLAISYKQQSAILYWQSGIQHCRCFRMIWKRKSESTLGNARQIHTQGTRSSIVLSREAPPLSALWRYSYVEGVADIYEVNAPARQTPAIKQLTSYHRTEPCDISRQCPTEEIQKQCCIRAAVTVER